MTSTPRVVDDAEALVRNLADELTRPRPGECLCCFVDRQLILAPCDGTHRHAVRYRDTMAPRATTLTERLSRIGGYCDCELFLNGFAPRPAHTPDGLIIDDEVVALPPCTGVRRGSVRPCTNWVRLR